MTARIPDSALLTPALIERIRGQFELDWQGIHGAPHWARVRSIGLELAQLTGADERVVELFSFLHDSRRFNDGHDPEHGSRAALFVAELAAEGALDHAGLDDQAFQHLGYACERHSDGLTEGDVTVRTCWDADRLDLGRVGIRPRAAYLCTEPARDPDRIERCWRRSRSRSR